MTSRERVTKALNHEPTDRVPREVCKLYGVLMMRKEEHDRMVEKFETDFATPGGKYGKGERERDGAGYCEVGARTDAWGCTWETAERGYCGEVGGSW